MKTIDLTHTIRENMPVYPGTELPKLFEVNSHEKNGFKETSISMYSHTGTHIDAPNHVFFEKTALDEFPAEQFIGKALVIDCRHIPLGKQITMAEFSKYGKKIYLAEFLLFNTGWDKKWDTSDYFEDYPCINDEVLNFIITGKYKGIGFDVMSLDPMNYDQLKRHKKLFTEVDIINIENLCNLDLCGNELFTFVCLPLKTENSDGAPARAIAIFEE